jgi:hypothetical protein
VGRLDFGLDTRRRLTRRSAYPKAIDKADPGSTIWGEEACHSMGTNVDDDDTSITTREWIRALSFSVVGGALVTALIVWFAFTFVFQSCGYGPACG